jgi:hypothetical protein
MKSHSAVLRLLHADRQTDRANLIGAFLELLGADEPKKLNSFCA